MSSITKLISLGCLVALSACGGGDSSSVSANDIRLADPQKSRDEASAATGNLPRFGSVTQSSSAGTVPGITGDAASASFDGRKTVVTIERTDGSRIQLDTANDRIGNVANYDPVLPGYTYRDESVLAVSDSSATLGKVYTNWNNTDPTDYLAGGYWMHVEGNPNQPSGVEIGAFVDGPEISGSTTLPRSGTASYQGEAAGFYAYAGSNVSPNQVGEFSTDISLSADFAANTISGCMGCNGGVDVLAVDVNTGEIFTDNVPFRVRTGTTSIEANGSFRNRSVTVESSDRTITSSDGSWGGQFSNIPTTDGDPRLVAGTAGARFTDATGGEGTFVGAWFGTAN